MIELIKNIEHNNYINLYKKQIRQDIKFFISSLNLNEMHFFGFTLNFPNYIDNKDILLKNINFEKLKLIELLKNIDLIEFVYLTDELHGSRQLKREELILNNQFQSKELIEVKNRSMVGLPHLHGVFGLRSIVSFENNENILLNIIEYLRMEYIDIEVYNLKTNKDILKYWNYCIKENKFENHYFINYSKFYENLYSLFSDKLDYFYIHKIKCLTVGYIAGNYNTMKGLLKLNSNSNAYFILYNLDLYFNKNNYKIEKLNYIYVKNKNFKYSWDFIGELENFLKENIINIFLKLSLEFKFQLKNNNWINLLIENITNVISLLKTNIIILPFIIITKNVVEFKDGLYFVNANYFYSYNNNKEENIEVYCNKHYNYYYKILKNKSPTYWLSCIEDNLKSKELALDFCANLGYYFNCDVQIMKDIKQKSIVIIGDSNTGKSSLITNPLIEYQGEENIGLISDFSNNFMFEHIENKTIIICDDFQYTKNTRSSLLKILNGEPILINKKYKNQKLYKNQSPLIFIFNKEQNDLFLKDIAFKNRLIIYTFMQTFKHTLINDFKNKITIEIPNILIYCNNLFFNKYLKKKELLLLRKNIKEKILKKNEKN